MDPDSFYSSLENVADAVRSTRPTALNLFWGVERVRRVAYEMQGAPLDQVREALVDVAIKMIDEDEKRNRVLGEKGAELLEKGSKVLTHCNAGSLATAFYGTALGVIYAAHEQGKIEHVWVDETRPVMQGSRLTTWELMTAGVPCALITDNMAAAIMKDGGVDAVIVGADHIAANGDVVNKIGTYGLAVLAKAHDIPFYVAAPSSTVDLMIGSADDVEIEHRSPEEVAGVTWSGVLEPSNPKAVEAFAALTEEGPYQFEMAHGHALMVDKKDDVYQLDGWVRTSPEEVPVLNPAFDVTPSEYVTAIITERGVARPDYEYSLGVLLMAAGGINELTIG